MSTDAHDEAPPEVDTAWAPQVDEWGVPESMFGPVPEDVYGLVGRIAMVSALLEESLHDLYCTLAHLPQEAAMGKSGSDLITSLRKVLAAVPVDHQEQARSLLDDAMTALERRHAVMHSIWPHHGQGPVHGWRGKRAVSKTNTRPRIPAQVYWSTISTDDLPAVLHALLDTQQRSRELLTWVAPRIPTASASTPVDGPSEGPSGASTSSRPDADTNPYSDDR